MSASFETRADLARVQREVERCVGAAADPWIGRVLGDRYRILQHLADGGMGRVYAGEHVRLGMSVAVKILDRAGWDDPALAGRFEREAIATAALRSPHIVHVFDWGLLPEGGCYLVMELLPGRDLAALITEQGLLSPARTLHVLRQLAIAIDYAHAHGIVHRDLKPENVMVDPDAEDFVTVLDFGVARDLRQTSTYSDYGEVIGTPEYMAPEQALGLEEQVGPASDLWALAVIAMEMLTGQLPFPDAPATETLRLVSEAVPRRPSELGLDVPGLDRVFDRAMSRRPADRPRSARELVEELGSVLAPLLREDAGARVSPACALDSPTPSARVRAVGAYALSADAAEVADLPAHELGDARLTSVIVLATLVLLGSAFAAGWMACLALACGVCGAARSALGWDRRRRCADGASDGRRGAPRGVGDRSPRVRQSASHAALERPPGAPDVGGLSLAHRTARRRARAPRRGGKTMIGLDAEDRERPGYETERAPPRAPLEERSDDGLDDEDWEEDWLFL